MLCSVLSSPDSSASILALPGEKRELGEEERSLFTWQVLFRPPTSGRHPGASCLAAVGRRTPGSLRGTVPQCGRCALNHLFWSLRYPRSISPCDPPYSPFGLGSCKTIPTDVFAAPCLILLVTILPWLFLQEEATYTCIFIDSEREKDLQNYLRP